MVAGCAAEATHWVETTARFCDHLRTPPPPETFDVCIYHLHELNWIETGDYVCSPECDTCRD